jgi:hypothetical protein
LSATLSAGAGVVPAILEDSLAIHRNDAAAS